MEPIPAETATVTRGQPKKRRRRPAHRRYMFVRHGNWFVRVGGRRRATGIPAAREVEAKALRDKWLTEYAARKSGLVLEEPEPRPVLTLRELFDLYFREEVGDY